MFSYVKSLMSRAVLGPSSKVENGNRDIWSHDAHQEMIQLIKFTSGAPGSPSLDIFVELGTVDHGQGGEESDKAEEVTEDMSNHQIQCVLHTEYFKYNHCQQMNKYTASTTYSHCKAKKVQICKAKQMDKYHGH